MTLKVSITAKAMADRAKWQRRAPVCVGDIFGNLTVVAEDERRKGARKHNRRWLMLCKCGAQVSVLQYNLWPNCRGEQGTQSCGGAGCRIFIEHGQAGSELWRIWCGMRDRCNCSTNAAYSYYGGRGIKVCTKWNTDFAAFAADIGPRPSPGHSVDRIDVNGNYEPENCRWATSREQHGNMRSNVFLEHDGKKMHLADWARALEINFKTILTRRHRGHSIENILRQGRIPRGTIVTQKATEGANDYQ